MLDSTYRHSDGHSVDTRHVMAKLTDTIVKRLRAPKSGNRITYDAGNGAVKGFGVRVTAAGSRSFILNYRTRTGRERRLTIGSLRISGDSDGWSTKAAREEADRLKRRVDQGEDPLASLEAGRDAKTVADMAKRFIDEHSTVKNRPSTTDGYQGQIDNWILPKL